MNIIDPHFHPPAPDPGKLPGAGGSNGILQNVSAMNIGMGENGFYADKQGIWLGNTDFNKAPFSVNMRGRAFFRDQLGQTIVDAAGLKSDTQFLFSSHEDFTDRQTQLLVPTNLENTDLTFVLTRQTNILVAFSVSAYLDGLSGGDAGDSPIGRVQLAIDEALDPFILPFRDMRMYTPETTGLALSRVSSQSHQRPFQFTGGQHTIRLKFSVSPGGTAAKFHAAQSSISYLTFGT